MAISYNGWTVSEDRDAINVKPFIVDGVSFPGGVRSGDVATVLGYVAREFATRVEALHDGWCWGYAYRVVRGSTRWSNHASGTAIDVNAPAHPLGVEGTFSSGQRTRIAAILSEVEGCVFWGGNYATRKDEMHFEINVPPGSSKLREVATRLRGSDDMSAADVEAINDHIDERISDPNLTYTFQGKTGEASLRQIITRMYTQVGQLEEKVDALSAKLNEK